MLMVLDQDVKQPHECVMPELVLLYYTIVYYTIL